MNVSKKELSYETEVYSGKHMICDIKEIQNIDVLNSIEKLKELLDSICINNEFTILHKIEHLFYPQGISIIYMLSESHISIHTFPEKQYMAFDIYTCRPYSDNIIYENIYTYLIEKMNAKMEFPVILNRSF
jgi:S-adenosylmethionine decarboxylase